MAIVCGSDFTESSLRAVTAAAHLAARTKMPLYLVHMLEIARDDEFGETWQALQTTANARLQYVADRVRELAGPVDVHVDSGLQGDTLLEVAVRVSAQLIVVGPVGRRYGNATLGGHADRIAQRSHVPVLVIRDLHPFEHWALESKPLRVVLGVDSSKSSETALRWIDDLRAFGPCDVVAIHLYWPPEQFRRLGLEGVRNYIEPDEEVTRTLEREFGERLARLPEVRPVRFRSEPHLGRVADRLAEFAAEEKADLVVVGSHDRSALDRMWEGSVSRDLLRRAQCSVACIPAAATAPMPIAPRMRRVLAATDFSPTGDSAIPVAYATCAEGGTVHLVHVVEASSNSIDPHDIFPDPPANRTTKTLDAARARLLEKVPKDAAAGGRSTQVHIIESHDRSMAICQAAERLGVDLVCVGTHGRSGAAKVLLGSIAQDVLSRSKRPVLLTRGPIE